MPSSKSSSQLSVCSSGGCKTNGMGCILSTRFFGAFGVEPTFQTLGCDIEVGNPVGGSVVYACNGELGRMSRDGCFDDLVGATGH